MPPAPPKPRLPPSSWRHKRTYELVWDALAAMPSHFRPEIHITGLNTPDLFTLNTPLGATIEEQAVSTLNKMRETWDPKKQYATYSFVRQPQTFPDVRLVRAPGVKGPDPIIMGVELKGWYVFAKEGEPSYRSKTTPNACAPADLIVVVPWALSEVISGRPVMFPPFIANARFVAEFKNYWWTHVRAHRGESSARGVVIAKGARPYPSKSDPIADEAKSDSGNNFGRIARTGLMDDYMAGIKNLLLSGVPIAKWLKFFQSLVPEGTPRPDER